jgi:hypothetical protein
MPWLHELAFFADFIDDQSNINPLKPKKLSPMETDQPIESAEGFPQTVSAALVRLKQQLQQDYEQAYPDLREIIHLVLDEEEANAWDLSSFPHLLLPDLVQAHISKLNLQPAQTKHEDVLAAHGLERMETYEPAFALCS